MQAHPSLGSNTETKEVTPKAKVLPIGMPKTVKIILDDNDDIPPTGLFVGHNGAHYMIVAGREVDCPVELLGILDDAILNMPVTDRLNHRMTGTVQRRRFNYRRV